MNFDEIQSTIDFGEKELSSKEILFKHVLVNKYIWMLAFANLFICFVRYGVIDWAPTYLVEVRGFNYKASGLAFFLYEYAGIVSVMLAGYFSDRIFKSRRTPIIIICMVLVNFAILLYWVNPVGNHIIDNISLVLIGFLIYGPVVLIGLQALDLVSKKAVGTPTGFVGMCGYVGGTGLANALFGFTVDKFGWNAGFILLMAACILSILSLISMWNVGGLGAHKEKKIYYA